MPVEVGPDGRIGIQVLAPVGITQHRPVSGHDYNGLTLEPFLHLRERMPDVAMIELGQLIHATCEADSECGTVREYPRRCEPLSWLAGVAPSRARRSDIEWPE
jgi:hypothetical protein